METISENSIIAISIDKLENGSLTRRELNELEDEVRKLQTKKLEDELRLILRALIDDRVDIHYFNAAIDIIEQIQDPYDPNRARQNIVPHTIT